VVSSICNKLIFNSHLDIVAECGLKVHQKDRGLDAVLQAKLMIHIVLGQN
jgi:hypothetical protein